MNKQERIPVIYASNNNYCPALAASILSLTKNSSKSTFIKVFILEQDISKINKQKLLSLINPNLEIEFINMDPFLKEINTHHLYFYKHFTLSTYFRFFIPEIFKQISKAIYIDCDTIILDDITKIYNTKLADNALIAASKDIGAIERYRENKDFRSYIDFKLKLKYPNNYFQGGLMLMDIKKLFEFNFRQKCIDKLKKIKKPLFVDQCIMNCVLEGKVQFLPYRWNMLSYFKNPTNKNNLHIKRYQSLFKDAKILHYATPEKPWQFRELDFEGIWYKYAKETPFRTHIEQSYTNLSFKNHILYSDRKKILKKFFSGVLFKKNSKKENCELLKKLLKIYKISHDDLRLILDSGLFDANYFSKNSGVNFEDSIDAAWYYLKNHQNTSNPSFEFDSKYYFENYLSQKNAPPRTTFAFYENRPLFIYEPIL